MAWDRMRRSGFVVGLMVALVTACAVPGDSSIDKTLPVRTTLRDLQGYKPVDQGVLVVPVIRIENEVEATITLSLGATQPVQDTPMSS